MGQHTVTVALRVNVDAADADEARRIVAGYLADVSDAGCDFWAGVSMSAEPRDDAFELDLTAPPMTATTW